MARLLVIVIALATSCVGQMPPSYYGSARAQNGQVSIGRLTGGSFGRGSFSAGEPGRNEVGNGYQPQYWNRTPYPMGGGKVIYGSTQARNGQVAIGRVSGGSFGQDAFSVGAPGRSYGYPSWNSQRGSSASGYGYNNQNGLRTSVRARNGQVSIGRVSGGSFGQGSFTAGEPGRNLGYGSQSHSWNGYQNPIGGGRVIYGSTHARNGQVAIGHVSGATFGGQDAFSVGAPGRTYGSAPAYAYSSQNGYPNNPSITGFNRGDGTSFAIDEISGGSYPDNSFSIGHGV